jgi:fucose permease
MSVAPNHRHRKRDLTMSNNTTTGRVSRLSTETKAAFKTTEFIAYVVILIGLFISSLVVDNGDGGEGFGAQSVWFYAVILTVGYMISRGLAKSGSRENYDRDEHNNRR